MTMTLDQIGMTEAEIRALIKPIATTLGPKGVWQVHIECDDLASVKVRLYPKCVRVERAPAADVADDFDDLDDDPWWDEEDEAWDDDDEPEFESPHLEYLARTAPPAM